MVTDGYGWLRISNIVTVKHNSYAHISTYFLVIYATLCQLISYGITEMTFAAESVWQGVGDIYTAPPYTNR